MKKTEQFKIVRDLRKEVAAIISGPTKFGLIILVVLFFGFGGWAVFAKIDKAAIAIGEIITGGNNRIVQHLEGGVIEELLVKEGDVVKQGQVLLKLSKTAANANVEIIGSTMNEAVAEYSRLVAERDGLENIKYPDEWISSPDKYRQLMDSQNQIFNERKNSNIGKMKILDERNNQLQSEIAGLNSQISASKTQLSYTNEEIAVVERLLASGNTTMTRLLNLKSRKSEIEGRVGELNSSIAKANQSISENKLQKINLKNENLNEVVAKIKEAQAKMNEFKERGGTATDTLSRTEIRAPISGIVKDLKYKTGSSSGVIPPNGEVMTIVPNLEELLAEVMINPIDIDVVRKPNLKTRVRLSSYSARHIPMISGVLTYVSADSFKDEKTGQNFYKGRVSIDTSELKKYLANNDAVNQENYLYPGMPVEVYIVTGERSPISYLFDPIKNDMRRAFREE
jgi:HlyD family secretion protein